MKSEKEYVGNFNQSGYPPEPLDFQSANSL
jgi:hypothetical protein